MTTGEERTREMMVNHHHYKIMKNKDIIGCMGQLGDTTHHFWNEYNMAKLDVLTLERKVWCTPEEQEGDEKTDGGGWESLFCNQ